MRNLQNYFVYNWRAFVIGVAFISVIICIFFFRIGAIPNGAHQSEATVFNNNISFKAVLKNPIDSPYYISRNTLRKIIRKPSLSTSRYISAIIGVICAISFFWLISLWYYQKVAILGTILFVSSSWLLRFSRLGLPNIFHLLSILLILCWALLSKYSGKPRKVVLLLATLSTVTLMYVPGMIWLILLGMVWRRKFLLGKLKHFSILMIAICSLFGIVLLAPLVYFIVKNPTGLYTFLGITPQLNPSFIVHNLINLPRYMFYKGPLDPLFNTGTSPILDIFVGLMFILGLYEIIKTIRLDRSKLTLGLLLLGIFEFSIGGLSSTVLILFPVYLIATAGISNMLDSWLGVFPRNPLARGIAIGLISIAVLFSATYNVLNYYIAWPNSVPVKNSFSRHI